jgi:hypothetical protein
MTKFRYIFLLIISLSLTNCDTDDDGFYNTVYIDLDNLLTIEPHSTTYNVGEYLRIMADFSRFQNENGQQLDIYATTGGASEFNFSYVIEKQTSDVWNVVTVLDSQLDIDEGDAQNGSYVYGHCIYNSTSQSFKYNVGFPLLAAGNYRLRFGYNSETSTNVILRSNSTPGKLILNIDSSVVGLNSGGYYNFTVN